jgi:cyclophilin family peptidyl-prolyl cis-trans isomerase
MVVIQSRTQQESRYVFDKTKQLITAAILFLFLLYWFCFPSDSVESQLRGERVNRPNRPASFSIVMDEKPFKHMPYTKYACAYKSLDSLTKQELHPDLGERHMTAPPVGGKVSLVCCNTTAGPLSIVAHHQWAPLGAERFLEMVTSGYFNSGIPFMRCVKGFLCQFGLNADLSKQKDFKQSIEDDPNWLPEGPKYRENEQGVKRFAQGYLAYAGSGPKSRSKQLIMSLVANGPLAGGSPWEVPWGELVGPESFETLGKINTEYGEHGPPQGRLSKEGASEAIRQEWPNLDYINSCQLVDERVQDDLVEESEESSS